MMFEKSPNSNIPSIKTTKSWLKLMFRMKSKINFFYILLFCKKIIKLDKFLVKVKLSTKTNK